MQCVEVLDSAVCALKVRADTLNARLGTVGASAALVAEVALLNGEALKVAELVRDMDATKLPNKDGLLIMIKEVHVELTVTPPKKKNKKGKKR